ncbi:MAG: ribosome biogenesis GTPase YlqF [Liquorilactobacillus nagelii]|jgi:ribosome biogenesis GTPase A|uniref:Ribosome biogenesis GTPase A n=1 Tax=Liquorilactobacillus nagelii TaxID=82688 RepID=A0A3Q8CCM2_9LACO|nr:ribosome biogenesis GTPase YlqF [Liquorilactobacillus nagelii]AUJ32174.1 ribosome biogenesis GTPase YlqF [Liquorilactobacillus nagelii]KRL40920.1 GTP-binding protein, GTPase [Liquorilactobacillus nagelii DSM 13675]MCC7615342.1 ribosome biogenesis GTPase YlqF [Liquorilactobacillus nagelii]MCP9315954.1 ribosome biogenesis GTPase YlqF [Liquorilactobacillus nagelii]QYH53879.1 ribosome biogenesis GTPase YlqF [Liquorilactobacillus nagelii DSM 13675]
MSKIQWYPGHMAKAIRQIKENLKMVDLVLELADARLPESSRNPLVQELIQNKPSLLLLTKKDLADPTETQGWVNYYQTQQQPVLAINSLHDRASVIEKKIQSVLVEKIAKQQQRGIQKKRLRVLCLGIPNVGKSTLLNQLVGKKAAQTGNRPGVTKAQQWLKVGKTLDLLDTPGILWPKFEDPLIGQKLALTGAIKDTLFAADDIALFALEYFEQKQPTQLLERYHLKKTDLQMELPELLLLITQKIGLRDDYERASQRIIFDCRQGKLGRYTLDQVPKLVEKLDESK